MLKIANVKLYFSLVGLKLHRVCICHGFFIHSSLSLCVCLCVHTCVQCTWTCVVQGCSSGAIHIVGFCILFVLRQAFSQETVWSPLRLDWPAGQPQESVCLPPECSYHQHTPHPSHTHTTPPLFSWVPEIKLKFWSYKHLSKLSLHPAFTHLFLKKIYF